MLSTEQIAQFTKLMVKKYIAGESKEQRKKRKKAEKLDSIPLVETPYQIQSNKKYSVLCLKHGTKYSAEYVNILYNMVMRNCTLDIDFYCLTDDSAGIYPMVKIIPLPYDLKGWWCKPYMFSNEIPIEGTVLYMDLDVVIASNIDKLFTYGKSNWCTIRDFTRKMRPSWQKYNSSVIKFESKSLNTFWKDFNSNKDRHMKKYFGDQDWLFEVARGNPASLFPDSWIQSWKWEIRQSKDINYNMPKGSRTLRTIENVIPPDDCCVCVFHGDPNPENCEDPWVVDNWK